MPSPPPSVPGQTGGAGAPPPPPQRLPRDAVARLDAGDLKALASASAAALVSVAKDQASSLAGHRRDRHAARAQPDAPAPPRRRRRFKRRWVVVPLVVTLAVAVLVVGGLGALAGMALGLW